MRLINFCVPSLPPRSRTALGRYWGKSRALEGRSWLSGMAAL